MKQLVSITTLFVAMVLLNSGDTTPESANISITSPSSATLLFPASAELDTGEASEMGTQLSLTLTTTNAKQLRAVESGHVYKGPLLTQSRVDSRVRRESLWPSRVQQRSIEIAMVANAQAATVVLVDVASRSIIGTIDVNPARVKSEGPGSPNYAQDTDVSPDGRTLYVSRGYVGDVAAFDIASGKLLWQRSLNTGRADHMAITPDGKSLFVSALMDNRVYRVAAATGEITGHFLTGVYPHDNKISRDGRRVYNSSIGPLTSLPRVTGAPPLKETSDHPYQLTVADVNTLLVSDRIRFDKGIRPWQFTRDEKNLYAQLSNEHAVVAYNLGTRKVVRRLELPVKPGITVADWDFEAPHHGLALTPDGRTLCLAGRGSDYAALVRAPDLKLIATVPVGDAPGWSETAANGTLCLVANTRSDDLSIISIPKRTEIVRLPIGDGPKHITVARIPTSVVAAVKARP
jgi:DNA-binding beta-propeller fold protein YncE